MLIINLIGLALISLIVWWFWLYKPAQIIDATKQIIEILVKDGIYQPSKFKIAANQSVKLKIFRHDASGCADTIVFPDFNISEDLPLDQSKTITLPPISQGEYSFHCPMMMYQGTLIVE